MPELSHERAVLIAPDAFHFDKLRHLTLVQMQPRVNLPRLRKFEKLLYLCIKGESPHSHCTIPDIDRMLTTDCYSFIPKVVCCVDKV